jgi:hypothetical protein
MELQTESEVFLMLLIKIVGGSGVEPDSSLASDFPSPQSSRPAWMRVLAMEVMRG